MIVRNMVVLKSFDFNDTRKGSLSSILEFMIVNIKTIFLLHKLFNSYIYSLFSGTILYIHPLLPRTLCREQMAR